MKNSCAFDVLLQCLATCYADISHFKKHCINLFNNSAPQTIEWMLTGIIMELSAKSSGNSIYHWRIEILRALEVPTKLERNIEILDCACDAYELLESIVAPVFPSIVSTYKCKCGTVEKKHPTVSVNTADLNDSGLSCLELSINQKTTTNHLKTTCKSCQSEKVITNIVMDTIFINVQKFKSQDRTDRTTLNKIQTLLFIAKEIYELKSVVQFIESTNPLILSHYIVHCKRNDKWIEYNDLNVAPVESRQNVDPYLLMFVKDNFDHSTDLPKVS